MTACPGLYVVCARFTIYFALSYKGIVTLRVSEDHQEAEALRLFAETAIGGMNPSLDREPVVILSSRLLELNGKIFDRVFSQYVLCLTLLA